MTTGEKIVTDYNRMVAGGGGLPAPRIPTDDEIMTTGCGTLETVPFARLVLRETRRKIHAAPSWAKLQPFIEKEDELRRMRGASYLCLHPEGYLEHSFADLSQTEREKAGRLQRRILKEAGLESADKWEIVLAAARAARAQV